MLSLVTLFMNVPYLFFQVTFHSVSFFYTSLFTGNFFLLLLEQVCSTSSDDLVVKVLCLVDEDVGCREALGVDRIVGLEPQQQRLVHRYYFWRNLELTG